MGNLNLVLIKKELEGIGCEDLRILLAVAIHELNKCYPEMDPLRLLHYLEKISSEIYKVQYW